MAVLVTGGAGFIGSNIVDELMMQGHEVVVLDNFSEGRPQNLVAWTGNGRLRVVRGDVRDFDVVRRAADGCDWVFHLAAMSRIQPSITDPMLAWSQNMIGTGNVLEAARQAGAKRVVYSASSSAYGQRNRPPLNEGMPTDCLNPYSLSKKVGEEMCDVYTRLYGLSTVSLRYFNVYGPRHQEEGSYATVIAIFRRQKRLGQRLTIVGDGTKRRDFTFVSDVVRANILAAMNRSVTGVVNVGTGQNFSINEVAGIIGGETTNIPDRPAESLVTLADASRARDALGWTPQISLKQGLFITDEYEKRNPPGGVVL